jgi:uncharacterized delta-60 repeat protein
MNTNVVSILYRLFVFPLIRVYICIKEYKMSHTFARKSISVLLGLILVFAGVSPALAADGSLDPTFGNGGIVTTDFGGTVDFGNSVALQPDGKIVMAGYTASGGSGFTFALARYNSDGSLDLTFDGDGKVEAGSGSPYKGGLADVALQPDGKIIVGGQTFNGANHDFILLRFNSDGSPDASFDLDGQVTTDFAGDEDYCYSIALQPDGKILAAGRSFKDGSLDFAVARYNADGSLDTSFGTAGKVTTDFAAGDDWGMALALQTDGGIVLAGTTNGDFALVRYNPDGTLDATFGTAGQVTTDFGGMDGGSDVAIQADYRIIVTGSAHTLTADIALARYNSDGSLDPTFDGDGKVTTDLAENNDFGTAVALHPDGRILVAGQTGQGSTMTEIAFALARYNSDGSLDTALNGTGWLSTSIGGIQDQATDIALQPDGKAVVAGASFTSTGVDFALVRYDMGATSNVTIDIKPNSQTNRINASSQGRVRVAILSSAEFDALALLDRASLRFGHSGLEDSLVSCRKRGTDVNHDGFRDLVCLFSIQEAGFRKGDVTGILTGQMLDGTPILGDDFVKVVGAVD